MAINYINLTKLIIITAVIFIIGYLSFVYLLPFIIALILAIIINPFVNFLNKKLKINRKLSVLIVLLFFLLSFITVITFSMIEFIELLQYLTKRLPTSFEDLFHKIEQLTVNKVDQFFQVITSYFNTFNPNSHIMIKSIISDMSASLKELSKETTINFLQDTIIWLTNVLKSSYYLIFILIGTFFISSDGPRWMNKMINHLKAHHQQLYIETRKEFVHLTKNYFLAQIFIIVITGLIVYIGLNIIQVSHAFGLALTAMLLDLIPLIGISAIFIPWIFYLFLTANYALTIKLSILFLILIIVRNLLEPKLIGSSIGVHPLLLLMILFAFLKIFGFLGFILGPITAVSISVLLKVGVFSRLKNYITN